MIFGNALPTSQEIHAIGLRAVSDEVEAMIAESQESENAFAIQAESQLPPSILRSPSAEA